MAKIVDIPVEKIKVGSYELRAGFDDEEINELARSIGRIGLIVPLVVRPENDGYILVAGHRRIRAAERANLKTVPCIVREDKPAEATEVSFAENLFRADLSPVELACGIRDCIDQGVMDAAGIATALHRTEYWVARQLALLSWPGDVLDAVHNGWLSVSAAANLAEVKEDNYRAFLLDNARDGGATARTTAAWLQAWRSMQPAEKAIHAEPVPAGERVTPMVPQAPCIVCGQIFRTDALAHIPVCQGCINTIRNAGR